MRLGHNHPYLSPARAVCYLLFCSLLFPDHLYDNCVFPQGVSFPCSDDFSPHLGGYGRALIFLQKVIYEPSFTKETLGIKAVTAQQCKHGCVCCVL